MKKIIFTFFWMTSVEITTTLSAMTIEQARDLVLQGDLNAARLLGSAHIPLPQELSKNSILCQKMWDIGNKQTILRTPKIEEERPKLSSEEIALQKFHQQEVEERLILRQKQNTLRQRLYSQMQKEKDDLQFSDHLIPKNISSFYKKQIEEAKRQKELEILFEEKVQFKTQKRDQIYSLEQEETSSRKVIESQYYSTSLFKNTYDEILILLACHEKAESLYSVALKEKTEILKKADLQQKEFKQHYLKVLKDWNFKQFFYNLSQLKTTEGDFIHDIKISALDFCKQHNLTSKKTKPSILFMFEESIEHPLLQKLDDIFTLPLRGLDPKFSGISPIAIARFILNPKYGFNRKELSSNWGFTNFSKAALITLHDDLRLNFSLKSLTTHAMYKTPIYNVFYSLHNGGINQLLNFFEQDLNSEDIYNDIYVDAIAILLIKNKPENISFDQYFALKFIYENLFVENHVSHFILSIIDPQNFHEKNLPNKSLEEWFKNIQVMTSFFSEESDKLRLKISIAELYIFVWQKLFQIYFSPETKVPPKILANFVEIFDAIYPYFSRAENQCKKCKIPPENWHKNFVVNYESEIKLIATRYEELISKDT